MANPLKLDQGEIAPGAAVQDARIEVAIEVLSGPTAARAVLGALMARLAPLSLEPEEASTVELILAEVLNNIVEHAYPQEGADGPIHLKCRQLADGLHFCVKDKGRRMPGDKAPVGQIQPTDVDVCDLPEGGFGWFLIQDLAKDVQYRRVGQENQLEMRIAVAYDAQ